MSKILTVNLEIKTADDGTRIQFELRDLKSDKPMNRLKLFESYVPGTKMAVMDSWRAEDSPVAEDQAPVEMLKVLAFSAGCYSPSVVGPALSEYLARRN